MFVTLLLFISLILMGNMLFTQLMVSQIGWFSHSIENFIGWMIFGAIALFCLWCLAED